VCGLVLVVVQPNFLCSSAVVGVVGEEREEGFYGGREVSRTGT
jgi:hypothetical protein